MKLSRSFSVWVNIMKMSSMILHQVCGWCGTCMGASVEFSEERLVYDGAMRVSMAVPCFWM